MFMKTNKWIILFFLFFCQCANDKMIVDENEFNLTISPGACFPEISDKYIYSDSKEDWIEANQVIDGTLTLCQLPDDVLKSISTPGLIDALIHAPLFTTTHLHTNLSALQWFRSEIYPKFNSASELLKRKDAGEALVAYYKLACLDCIEPLTGVDSFSHCCPGISIQTRFNGLEYLFTIQEILDKMKHRKKQEAVAAILVNYERYMKYWNAIVPMAYIMLADEYKPIVKYFQEHNETFSQFVLEGWGPEGHEDAIISFAKSFIKNKN